MSTQERKQIKYRYHIIKSSPKDARASSIIEETQGSVIREKPISSIDSLFKNQKVQYAEIEAVVAEAMQESQIMSQDKNELARAKEVQSDTGTKFKVSDFVKDQHMNSRFEYFENKYRQRFNFVSEDNNSLSTTIDHISSTLSQHIKRMEEMFTKHQEKLKSAISSSFDKLSHSLISEMEAVKANHAKAFANTKPCQSTRKANVKPDPFSPYMPTIASQSQYVNTCSGERKDNLYKDLRRISTAGFCQSKTKTCDQHEQFNPRTARSDDQRNPTYPTRAATPSSKSDSEDPYENISLEMDVHKTTNSSEDPLNWTVYTAQLYQEFTSETVAYQQHKDETITMLSTVKAPATALSEAYIYDDDHIQDSAQDPVSIPRCISELCYFDEMRSPAFRSHEESIYETHQVSHSISASHVIGNPYQSIALNDDFSTIDQSSELIMMSMTLALDYTIFIPVPSAPLIFYAFLLSQSNQLKLLSLSMYVYHVPFIWWKEGFFLDPSTKPTTFPPSITIKRLCLSTWGVFVLAKPSVMRDRGYPWV